MGSLFSRTLDVDPKTRYSSNFQDGFLTNRVREVSSYSIQQSTRMPDYSDTTDALVEQAPRGFVFIFNYRGSNSVAWRSRQHEKYRMVYLFMVGGNKQVLRSKTRVPNIEVRLNSIDDWLSLLHSGMTLVPQITRSKLAKYFTQSTLEQPSSRFPKLLSFKIIFLSLLNFNNNFFSNLF